jgi:hypothetical protein
VITETPSWVEHIPFAFWIVGAAAPRVIVELGTHYGNSYFAFAQSVREQGLSTLMFAVDTWKGDEHAGFYGEEVFLSVSEYNGRNFAAFSTLVRMTFDEALGNFEDGEVDLLHIDGHHTYEAVSHDFESWLPKLSARGVVLFHDVELRERDFGVHRLWAELAERYPTLAFDHGHGLGVAGIGAEVPEAVRALLELDTEAPAAVAVRRLFATLGRRVALEAFETEASKALVDERRTVAEDLERMHTEREAILAERDQLLEQLASADVSLRDLMTEMQAVRGALGRARTERDRIALRLLEAEQEAAGTLPGSEHWAARQQLVQTRKDHNAAQEELVRTRKDRSAAQKEIQQRTGELQRAEADILKLLESTSWRITAPFRWLGRLMGR